MAGAKKTTAPVTKGEETPTLLSELKAGTADTSSPEFQAAMAQVIEHLNGAAHFLPKID